MTERPAGPAKAVGCPVQTKLQSAVEVLAGTASGFIIALLAQIFIMELYGIQSSLTQDLFITLYFTGISIIRGYAVRRFFNWLFHKGPQ